MSRCPCGRRSETSKRRTAASSSAMSTVVMTSRALRALHVSRLRGVHDTCRCVSGCRSKIIYASLQGSDAQGVSGLRQVLDILENDLPIARERGVIVVAVDPAYAP